MYKNLFLLAFSGLSCFNLCAQNQFLDVTASTNEQKAELMFDNQNNTGWSLSTNDLKVDQEALFKLAKAGDLCEISINVSGLNNKEFQDAFAFHYTYDPMNPGPTLVYKLSKKGNVRKLSFPARYGAFLKMIVKGNKLTAPIKVNEVSVSYVSDDYANTPKVKKMPWYNSTLSIDERVESVLAEMTPRDKMEMIREGWGIPGIKHLGIPPITKVEAIHGVSYKKGSTVFPHIISMSATWNKDLIHKVGVTIGKEMVDAHYVFAWSPVLDVAQDPRWGRCEETFGEDPVLVSELSGQWIEGLQSQGVFTTPKHFAVHGAPLGGRDSHDIGLSEREMREVHLVPFRNAFRNLKCQSTMMAYSDFLGVPVAKSHELLVNILREEWGFDGYIVSDCGALNNMIIKHYVAKDRVEAAKNALAVGIGTNCGNVYNDKEVIQAAVDGRLNMDDLDDTCRDMLRVIIRNGLLENNPAMAPKEEQENNPTFNCPEHRQVALQVAQESMTLLKNENKALPLSKNLSKIAVIGPAADNLQIGDYSAQTEPSQLKSVLTGIKEKVGKNVEVVYEQGCDFYANKYVNIEKAVEVAKGADVAVVVVGDFTNSVGPHSDLTSGENADLATLLLQGKQEELLKAVCATGTPVIAVYQIGRPYNLTYASEHAKAILVNWIPGQEGGYATADALFGDYNPAGRLSMTFPRDAAQLPLYYNFKTSGRGYDYKDLPYNPLYRFGYGLSYTKFKYADFGVKELSNGNVKISAKVTNVGEREGDEVVQLYATDMFASVKTRVVELKDFTRIRLKPQESKVVEFELTPYELSLLNDRMDRVVEKGEYRFFVGGVSPEYEATDNIKHSLKFATENDGVMGSFEMNNAYAADMVLSNARRNDKGQVCVTVENQGNLTDIGEIKVYVDNKQVGYSKHFELDPQQKKEIVFNKIKVSPSSRVMFVGKKSSIEIN